MEPEVDYFKRTMNEIVFEKKNKAYGAFLLRQLYHTYLLRALIIVVTAFAIGTSAPLLIRHFGMIKDQVEFQLDTTVFELHAPPSIQPLVPTKSAPPIAAEVQRPTEKLVEMEAVKDPLPEPEPIKDLDKKDIGKERTDKPADPPLNPDDLANNTGAGSDGKVWNKVEQPPEFIGGEEARNFYMSQNLVYPNYERGKGIEGVARIYFIINQDGSVSDVKIIRSSGNVHLDQEAARLIQMQPKFKPGMQNNRAVRVATITDIEFKLR